IPETAINSTYIDKKMPIYSDISIRGRIFKAEVFKMKQEKNYRSQKIISITFLNTKDMKEEILNLMFICHLVSLVLIKKRENERLYKDNIYIWEILIFGPNDTLYENGIFPARMIFTKRIPKLSQLLNFYVKCGILT
ncbi:hypothetical protein NQ315_004990, partial [Exocentrus adspersus]